MKELRLGGTYINYDDACDSLSLCVAVVRVNVVDYELLILDGKLLSKEPGRTFHAGKNSGFVDSCLLVD